MHPHCHYRAGQREVHTVKEYVELDEYVTGCKIAVMAATGRSNFFSLGI